MNPREEIEQLTKQLEQHNYLYYVMDSPEIADYEYDQMLRRLETLEAEHPELASPLAPTRRGGGGGLAQCGKVGHAVAPVGTPGGGAPGRAAPGAAPRWGRRRGAASV